MKQSCLLIDVLREPYAVGDFSPSRWDLLIRQARSANLLAYLAELLHDHLSQQPVDGRISQHLQSARRVVSRQNKAVRWEISLLSHTFAGMGIPLVALKGTAYVLAELPNSNSRLFHDIDILVPRAALEEVESTLRKHGWRTTHNNAYDQRYYRRWMHELPPMQHRQRQTVLDVHHSILPLTARIRPDPQALLQNAVAAPEFEEVYWLAPEDMVLHSMTHLFYDGELENGLRDLVDIDRLLRHFAADDGFWLRLCERAERLQLTLPLRYALRYAKRVFATPIPEATLQTVSAWSQGPLPGKLMDLLFLKGLKSVHPTCSTRGASMARWMLYIRAHYLRMPLRLLLPHLLHKALAKDAASGVEIPRRLRKIVPDADKS